MSDPHKGPLGVETPEENHLKEGPLEEHLGETHQKEVHQGETHQGEDHQQEETQMTTIVKETKSIQGKSAATSIHLMGTEPRQRNSKWSSIWLG